MNFRPIFRNRFKDDMKGVALFMALLLLCNAFIVSLLLVVSAQVQGQAFSNFSVAMSCFTLAMEPPQCARICASVYRTASRGVRASRPALRPI